MNPTAVIRQTVGLTLAASLLVSAQNVWAADAIGITPSQRQITADKAGIITLRFEVENRSGQTQQLEESLILPDGWDLVTNTAPFLLASGARETRLIHVVVPRGAAAGNYRVQYQVTAQNNGAITSSQTVTIQMAEQAGIKLIASAPPSSLLAGEDYRVDFLLENTGNGTVTYKLTGSDEENYITSISHETLTLAAGESGTITISGKIPRDLEETTSYRLTLEARGGGKLAEESVTIPLIARTPKGVGKYQKLPGKLTTRYTQQQRQHTDGSTSTSYQAQAEYQARGALDAEGEHRVEMRVRNGKNSTETTTHTNQQAEYQLTYDNGTWEVKTGNHNFHTSNLSGNALSGTGVETIYTPSDKKQHKPLEVRAFTAKSRTGDTNKAKVTGASARYQWDEFDTSVSTLQADKAATATTAAKKETITAINVGWQGENLGIRAETAKDNDGKAWSIDANGQWHAIGVNVSHLQADAKFDGSQTDTIQSSANARYQLDEATSIETSIQRTRTNISGDTSKEIRQDNEQQAKINRRFGDEQQIEASIGQRKRSEKDLRTAPTADRDIRATTISYQHQFETFQLRAELEHGTRKDRIKGDAQGNKYSLNVNWKPSKKLGANASYTLSDGLDSDGKTHSAGINADYQINRKTHVAGYLQRNQNTSNHTHSDSFEARLTHDMRRKGTIGFSARRTASQASDGKTSHDNLVQLEYSVPLDIPLRKRDNIGSVRGQVRYAADKRPASEIVVQMGGQYAVTDANGQFHYPDVPAKAYAVQVDASRSNAQGYVLSGMNGEDSITVAADQTAEPVLELYPASRIQGTLQLYEVNTAAAAMGDAAALRPSKGLGMVLIELHPVGNVGKRIVHKRTTLHDGSFSFVGIPPGQWQLVVVDTNKVPDNYRLEQSRFDIDLSSGGTQDVVIRAVPAAQRIQKTGPSGGFDVAG